MVAIISGGGGYVGSAICRAFRREGWDVVVLSRTGKASDGAVGIVCDLTQRVSVKAAIDEIVGRFGKIHACIHAVASPLERVSMLDVTDASVRETMDTAYLGAVHLAQAVVPQMDASGTFIGITSGAIEPGDTIGNMGSYIPAKYALRGFLRALSADPLARGLRVYAVAPGFLPGGLNDDLPKIVKDVLSKASNVTDASIDELGTLIAKLATDASIPSGSSISFPSQNVTPL
jgi:NAD(P)-dependent dehydrogenase (short-subunit alcohol dehydrogenase family)